MSKCLILSDKPLESYEEFLGEAIRDLNGLPVRSIAVVALLEDKSAVVGYHNMDLFDQQLAAAQIQADITDAIVRANIAGYLQELESGGEEEEETE